MFEKIKTNWKKVIGLIIGLLVLFIFILFIVGNIASRDFHTSSEDYFKVSGESISKSNEGSLGGLFNTSSDLSIDKQ